MNALTRAGPAVLTLVVGYGLIATVTALQTLISGGGAAGGDRFLDVESGRVLALGTERGVSAATGRPYATSSAWLWNVHASRATEMLAFHDTAAMAR